MTQSNDTLPTTPAEPTTDQSVFQEFNPEDYAKFAATTLRANRRVSDANAWEQRRQGLGYSAWLTDAPLGIAEGVAHFGQSAMRLTDDISTTFGGNAIFGEDYTDPIQFTRTNLGSSIGGVTQFALAYETGNAGNWIGSVGESMGLGGTALKIAKGTVGTGLAEFLTDDHRDRLSNTVQKMAEAANMPTVASLAGNLAHYDDEGVFASRFKRALEGASLGFATDMLFQGVGSAFKGFIAKKAGRDGAKFFAESVRKITSAQEAASLWKDVSTLVPQSDKSIFDATLGQLYNSARVISMRGGKDDPTVAEFLGKINFKELTDADAKQFAEDLAAGRTDALAQNVAKSRRGPYAVGPEQIVPGHSFITSDPATQRIPLSELGATGGVATPAERAAAADALPLAGDELPPPPPPVGDNAVQEARLAARDAADTGLPKAPDLTPMETGIGQLEEGGSGVRNPDPYEPVVRDNSINDARQAARDAQERIQNTPNAPLKTGPEIGSLEDATSSALRKGWMEDPDQRKTVILGLTRLMDQTKVEISLAKNSTPLTFVEEMVHGFFLRYADLIPEDMQKVIRETYKLADGVSLRDITAPGVRDAHEGLAQQWLRASLDGITSEPKLKEFYDSFSQAMMKAYEAYDAPQIAQTVDPKLRILFESLMGTNGDISKFGELVTKATADAKATPGADPESAKLNALAQALPAVPADVQRSMKKSLIESIQQDRLKWTQSVEDALTPINMKRVGVGQGFKAGVKALEDEAETTIREQLGGVKSNELTNDEATSIAEVLGTRPEAMQYAAASSAQVKELAVKATVVRKIYSKVAEDAIKVARIAAVDKSAQGAFNEAFAKLTQMMAYRKTVSTEIGRALQSFNIVATPVDTVLTGENVLKMLQEGKSSMLQRNFIRAVAMSGEDGTVTEVVRAFEKKLSNVSSSLWNIHNEYWINALLSGPRTFGVNFMSQQLMTMLLPATRIAGGALTLNKGEIASGARVYLNMLNVFKDMFSMTEAGLRVNPEGALSPTWKAFRNEQSILDGVVHERAITATNVGLSNESIAGKGVNWLGKAVRLPSRFLTTADELFKQVNYRAWVRNDGWQAAVEKGLAPGTQEFDRFVDGFVRASFGSAGEALNDAGLAKARAATFTQSLERGTILGDFNNFVQSHPSLRVIVPFIKVPSNMLKTFVDYSPLGALTKSFRTELLSGDAALRADAAGRLAIGVGFWSLAGFAAATGKITGSGPGDPALRDQLLATGWRPFSFAIPQADGTKRYVEYKRIEPLAYTMGLVADFVDMHAHIDDMTASQIAAAMSASFARNLTSKTYLKTASDIIGALSDTSPDQSKMMKLMESRFGSYIPNVSAQTNEDDQLHQVKGIMDAMRARIPGLSNTLPPKRDLFGDPVHAPAGWAPFGSNARLANILSPVRYSDRVGDPVKEELAKLQFGFSLPSKNLNGVDLSLITNGKQDAHDRLQQLQGQVKVGGRTLPEALTALFESERYKSLPDPTGPNDTNNGRVALAQSVIGRFRQAASMQVQREYPQILERRRELLDLKREGRTPLTPQTRVLQKIAQQ
jgi:hypothetical protein